jgi:peptidoglycan/xylan/chitin deacetylase (PgdA/CDA1 family)
MASVVKKFSQGLLGWLVALTCFGLLTVKYYAPVALASATNQVGNYLTMNTTYLAVLGAMTLDPALREDRETTEMAAAVPVILYHGLPWLGNDSDISAQRFREQMFALKRNGWQTISLEQFVKFMRGEIKLPAKSFLLTFDDGVRSSWRGADPVLKALDYQAVMFIITNQSLGDGSHYYLSRAEVDEMINSGRWEIQCHAEEGHIYIPVDQYGSTGHYYSNLLWLADQNRQETVTEYRQRIGVDMRKCRNGIESLGQDPIGMAFPFGDFGQNSLNLPNAQAEVLRQEHDIFPYAFHEFWPSTGYTFNYPFRRENSFLIRRISVLSDWDGDKLLSILEAARDKSLPFKPDKLVPGEWINAWGDLVYEHDGMTVSASEKTTGGLVFLDGTEQWTNYNFTATATVQKGQSLTLIGRYRDPNNYLACTFTNDGIDLKVRHDGQEDKIAEQTGAGFSYNTPTTFRLNVVGQGVTCGLGNQVATSTNVPWLTPQGGIGFAPWDPSIDNSSVFVSKVEAAAVQ